MGIDRRIEENQSKIMRLSQSFYFPSSEIHFLLKKIVVLILFSVKGVSSMRLCDIEDYFLDPSKLSASFIVNKITKILEDRFIKFWRRTVWSGIRNTNAQSYGNKLRL